MLPKLKYLLFALLSFVLFVNAFPVEEYSDNDLTVHVETLHVSPRTKVLAISINQIDQIIDENGEQAGQTRVLALNLKVDEKQLIDDGPMFYRNVPVFAIDVEDKVDIFEMELMDQSPDLLPVKMYAWADVEYDEDQDIFVPRVILQTQVLDHNVVQNEVVQVVIDLPESGDISVYPPRKLPLDQVYYRPEGNQPWMPFSELDDEETSSHRCGGKRLARIFNQIQNYLNNAAESIEIWYYKVTDNIETWANEHVGELQLFALIWMSLVAVVIFFFALPILLFLRIRNSSRQNHHQSEHTEALLSNHDAKVASLPHHCNPVKIEQVFSTGEEKGLLDDHE
ncbi:hypothetical protein K7432_008312 [Basidiobolus ranarum]|uniref:Uncharacterized protein n=1 Tax=Basidiobolus ranarum TaxID=34480 RepID=A0ABR2VZA5_9FUNG